QKPNTPGKCAMLCARESQELWGVYVIVHNCWVLPIRQIVDASAQSQVITKQMEAALEVSIQRKVGREALGVRRANKLLLLVHQVEGKAVAPINRVSEVKLLYQG